MIMTRGFVLIIAGVLTVFLAGCIGAQAPAPVQNYGTSKGPGSAGVHNVIPGDTLWRVSQRYKIPMQDIVQANDIKPPYTLSVGQRLRLPPPREYRVRAGDTLYGVSRVFDVSTADLARQNNLRSPYILRTGQILRLPVPMRTGGASSHAVSSSVKTAAVKADHAQLPTKALPAKTAAPSKVSSKTSSRQISSPRVPKRSSSGKFLKPVPGKVISGYGPKKNGLHNDGINIKAPRGTPVKATENGVVVYAGNALKGSGNLVLVRHDDGWMSAYAHMDSIRTKKGTTIDRGALIGTVGSTGSVDTPQLHFELRRGTNAVNPGLYMGG